MRVLTYLAWATTALLCYLIGLAAVEYGFWDDHPSVAASLLFALIWWLVAERDALLAPFRRDDVEQSSDDEHDGPSGGHR